MASIKEVAEAAGVSTATVSRVLSNNKHVRPEVRQRVMETVDSLRYRPNLVARSLRAQQTRTLGLIVSDIRNPFFTSISRAVEDIAYAAGFSILLCNTDEDPSKEEIYLQVMRDTNVAGIIISPTLQRLTPLDARQIECPIVVVDRTLKDFNADSIVLDNVDSAYRLTEHLIDNGFQRIGILYNDMSSTGQQRCQGFEKALRARGLPVVPDYVRAVPPRVAAGFQATLELLSLKEPPDALLTTNSLTMEGALSAIRERQFTIPTDMALVGFDETPWASLIQPAITLIEQPTYEIGRTAAELLLQRLEDPARPMRRITLRGELRVRGSSAPRSLHSSLPS